MTTDKKTDQQRWDYYVCNNNVLKNKYHTDNWYVFETNWYFDSDNRIKELMINPMYPASGTADLDYMRQLHRYINQDAFAGLANTRPGHPGAGHQRQRHLGGRRGQGQRRQPPASRQKVGAHSPPALHAGSQLAPQRAVAAGRIVALARAHVQHRNEHRQPPRRIRRRLAPEPAGPESRLALRPALGMVAGRAEREQQQSLAGTPFRAAFHSDRAALCHARSEERRVGKEGRSRWSPYH